jgi:hypothetical protein
MDRSFTIFVEQFNDQNSGRPISGFPKDLDGNPTAFLTEIRLLDSLMDMCSSLQITVVRKGCLLEWEHEVNQRGGRFRLHFSSNTNAFRTFCLVCHDWLIAEFPFSERIVGTSVSLNPLTCSWSCQIWVDEGLRSFDVEPRWNDLMRWLGMRTGIREDLDLVIQMEFRLHPTYRKYRTEPNAVRKEAAEITPFASCVKRALGRDAALENPKPVFNLAIATTYKRKWSERRLPRAE